MDIYYTLRNSGKFERGVYVGADPNLKNQECFIISENDNKLNVIVLNDYLGDFELCLDKKDIFLA